MGHWGCQTTQLWRRGDGGWAKGFGVGWQLIHFAAACALSVGVNFDEQQEDGQIDRQTAGEAARQTGRQTLSQK